MELFLFNLNGKKFAISRIAFFLNLSPNNFRICGNSTQTEAKFCAVFEHEPRKINSINLFKLLKYSHLFLRMLAWHGFQ